MGILILIKNNNFIIYLIIIQFKFSMIIVLHAFNSKSHNSEFQILYYQKNMHLYQINFII